MIGTWPTVRGQLNGSFPPGATSPNSRSATAAPPWVPGYQIAGGAGGARTHDRRIMRSTAPCGVRASCTDDTDHRTSGTRNAGIWRAGPRAVPRSDCSAPDNLLAGNAPTNRLQEVRPRARCALAARIARIIALTALTPLAISGAPVHEPVHVARQAESPTVTQRSDRGPCGPPAPARPHWTTDLTDSWHIGSERDGLLSLGTEEAPCADHQVDGVGCGENARLRNSLRRLESSLELGK